MLVSIADLKAHVTHFIESEGLAFSTAEHNLVAKFADYVEGNQAIADAVNLLVNKHYTVTPPPVAVAPT